MRVNRWIQCTSRLGQNCFHSEASLYRGQETLGQELAGWVSSVLFLKMGLLQGFRSLWSQEYESIALAKEICPCYLSVCAAMTLGWQLSPTPYTQIPPLPPPEVVPPLPV